MLVATANQAAAIAPQYAGVQDLIAIVQRAKDEHWLVTQIIVSAPDGRQISLVTSNALDDATSQLTLTTAIGIYQQQLAALQAQLDAL